MTAGNARSAATATQMSTEAMGVAHATGNAAAVSVGIAPVPTALAELKAFSCAPFRGGPDVYHYCSYGCHSNLEAAQDHLNDMLFTLVRSETAADARMGQMGQRVPPACVVHCEHAAV